MARSVASDACQLGRYQCVWGAWEGGGGRVRGSVPANAYRSMQQERSVPASVLCRVQQVCMVRAV